MDFNHLDILIIAVYFLITFSLGLMMSRRARQGLTEYFLSGRSVPWWLAGTGMVATTFAADTPLWVAGVVGASGIAGNWFWWCAAAGGMLTVFLFARLWRRSGVMTDLELIDIRYSGDLRHFLRGFKALYFGLVLNTLIIGWVNLAMMKILSVVFPEYDPRIIISLCAGGTVLYVAAAGLWGVAVADLFQFCIAMGGCIALAVMSMSPDNILQKLPPEAFDFFPTFWRAPGGCGRIKNSTFNFFYICGGPVVGFLVSRRRAGRWRLCGPTDYVRERRKVRDAGHTLVCGCPLLCAFLALDNCSHGCGGSVSFALRW